MNIIHRLSELKIGHQTKFTTNNVMNEYITRVQVDMKSSFECHFGPIQRKKKDHGKQWNGFTLGFHP